MKVITTTKVTKFIRGENFEININNDYAYLRGDPNFLGTPAFCFESKNIDELIEALVETKRLLNTKEDL